MKVKTDPKTPRLGAGKFFQLPYQRKISTGLGQKKSMPVGPPIKAQSMPITKYEGQRKTLRNFKGTF
jgi:hypothetical protein